MSQEPNRAAFEAHVQTLGLDATRNVEGDYILPKPSVHAVQHYARFLMREAQDSNESTAKALSDAAKTLEIIQAENNRLHQELIDLNRELADATDQAWAAIADLTDDARIKEMPLADAIYAVASKITESAAVRADQKAASPTAPSATDEPDQALLISMATCLNHGFGLLPKDHQDSMLHDMRKLWDEMAGKGYYRPEKRERYLSMVNENLDPDGFVLRAPCL